MIKKIIKITLIVVSILAIIIGLGYWYYLYKLEKYYLLTEGNEKFIKEKVWAKDSDGKGYSDKGQLQMESDLKGVDDPKIWNLYKAYLRQVRKLTVSKNQQDYINNYKVYSKLMDCITFSVPSVNNVKWLLKEQNSTENDNLIILDEFLFQKYTKRMKYDDVYDLLNTSTTKEECERLSK